MFNLAWLVTIRILPFFFVGIVSILLITHSSPPPSIVTSGEPGFSTCRLPCWAGLWPSQTAFNGALETVTANLPSWGLNVQVSGSRISLSGSQKNEQVSGIIYEDRGLVGSIRLEVDFPLWYLIEELGKPYCVRANHLPSIDMDVVVVYWNLADMSVMGIITLDPSEKWYPDVRIEALITMTSSEQCTLIDALPWMGFARLWLYQTGYAD